MRAHHPSSSFLALLLSSRRKPRCLPADEQAQLQPEQRHWWRATPLCVVTL
jgi:hypothetical protein